MASDVPKEGPKESTESLLLPPRAPLTSQLSSSSKGRLDVRVVRQADGICSNKDSEKVEIESYEMAEERGKKHGLMLIVEFDEFKDALSKREGSHVDVENLRDLFRQLRFEVLVSRNLTLEDFKSTLKDFADDERHAEAHMMILAILSHGDNGVIYTSDGKTEMSTEDILKQFNNKNCERLSGKPKFFIFQACRGKESDFGHRMDSPHRSATTTTKKRYQSGDTLPMLDNEGAMVRARPTWEDMIIAYSTIPGYVSIRDHDEGTWFIQSLVLTFQDHAWYTELNDLMRLTAKKLSGFVSDISEKQTCNVEMRNLYKKIYFSP